MTDDEIVPEKTMWGAVLNRMVEDVIYPFRIPSSFNDSLSIDGQEERFKVAKRLPMLDDPTRAKDYRRAVVWMESSALDETVQIMGYDSLFVSKVVTFVQDCMTRRKKIYEARYE